MKRSSHGRHQLVELVHVVPWVGHGWRRSEQEGSWPCQGHFPFYFAVLDGVLVGVGSGAMSSILIGSCPVGWVDELVLLACMPLYFQGFMPLCLAHLLAAGFPAGAGWPLKNMLLG